MTCLRKLVLFCGVLSSVQSVFFAQTPSPSITLATATCGLPVCTWNAFGPKTYSRETGKPQAVTSIFSILNIHTQYALHIDNNSVASAAVSINGAQVFGPSDFGPNVIALDRPVELASSNTLSVELRGKPGASLTLTVVGVDSDPPSINELATPPPNGFRWNNTDVQINFSCSDSTSGIALCPNSLLLATEGLNQIVSGTAFDRAGNSATSSIQVSIDKTPPTITASQSPAPNSAGWNNSAVTVSFNCADVLSGVASCPSPMVVSSEGANQQVSGAASDKAGNIAGTSLGLNIDETPPVITVNSPANAVTVTAATLAVVGAVSDNLSGLASLSCNGSLGVVSNGAFTCNVSLVAGANMIQVQAMDNAGNIASTQVSVTLNSTPPPAPKSILITPSTVNLLVGDTRPVRLVGDIGQVATGASWSISDPAIATISSTDPPQITAIAQGTATLTGTFNGLTAAMTINVLPGTTLPAGTALWAFDPLPGNTITQMVPGNPVNPGDPDIFALEAPNTLRAFTKEGLELWAVPVGASTGSAANVASGSEGQRDMLNLQSQSPPTALDATQPLASIPSAAQGILRKHGAFDSVDLMLRRQRLIEQQRRRAASAAGSPLSASPLSSASQSANAATPGLITLLIKAVPDNSGGVINLVETLSGCCAITQTSFIKIDTATQQQVWRHDFTGAIDENFAIAADSTVYSSQLIFPAVSNPFAAALGSASSSNIFALDGDTGQEKFNVALPPGHFKLTDAEGNSSGAVLADVDLAAQPGPLSILPDGSINTVVYTNHLAENFQNLFLFSGFETAVSDHKTLQLFTIQRDGSFTTKSIQGFDFDATGCASGCNDPSAGYIPNEVIPDGQGGLLATWTGNDTQLGITSGSAAVVRHFDNAGGILDYAVPFASQSWFRVGGNNPQGLVLGKDNTAFGSDGRSIVAFDVNTGALRWNFQPDGFQGAALLGANAQGGITAVQLADLAGEFDASPNALLALDSTGTPNATPFVGNSSDLGYFDADTLLGVAENGQGEMLAAPASLDENELWEPQGNRRKQRVALPPHPVNFRIVSFKDEGGGATALLSEVDAWDSSTGHPQDLKNCTIREVVAYPTNGPGTNQACPDGVAAACFFPPSPPWPPISADAEYPNPTIPPVEEGNALSTIPDSNPPQLGNPDTIKINTNLRTFVKPYSNSSFAARQQHQYKCGTSNWVNLGKVYIITRQINQNSAGKFAVTISKTDISITSTVLLPNQ